MKSRWVIGAGACMEHVFNAWTRAYPDENVERITLLPGDDDVLDVGVLDALEPNRDTIFVAFDETFGRFRRSQQPIAAGSSGLDSFIRPSSAVTPDILRLEFVEAAMERGFVLESFVGASAIVAADVIIGPNVFIGEGVVLGMGTRVECNTVVRDGAKIGAGVRLGCSCWLDTGVLVGDGADIEAHCALRMGTVVASRVNIGRHCELGWARLYDRDLPSRTVFEPGLSEPIYVHGN